MNAHSATDDSPLKEVQVRRLAAGARFEDWNGQVFTKLGEVVTQRGEKRHQVRCEKSPFPAGSKMGPVCSAFFCAIGDVVYLGGNRRVLIPTGGAA